MRFILGLTFCLAFSASSFGDEVPVEFRGVMIGGGTTKLSLFDKAADRTQWVEVGQTFAGFTVKTYDAEKEIATLRRGESEIRLRLNSSQVAEAGSSLSEEDLQAIRNNLRQISAAADQYFMETGKKNVSVSELVGPGKYIKQLIPIDGETYGNLTLKQQDARDLSPGDTDPDSVLSVVTKTGARVDYNRDDSFFVQQLAPETHAVSAGETATKIAEFHGFKLSELQALNPNVDWTRLKVGQTLKLK